MSSNYAALACLDLPTCNGEWLPRMDFQAGFNITQGLGPNYLGGILDSDARVAIHLVHRLGAVIVTLYLLAFAVFLWRQKHPLLNRFVFVMLVILALQVTMGLLNIYLYLPLPIAVGHNLGGACLLASMFYINYQLYSTLLRD